MPGVYDRLSPLDRYFLIYESPSAHMHVAGASIFESPSLRRRDGGLDIARIRAYIEARLAHIPRYRQVVRKTPFGTPIWVDDRFFNLEYHVRHTSLPRPGEDAQLKALCGRLFSQPLDRARPLWEIWVVEGLDAGDQFAFISKIHHAMVDGVSAVDLLEVLLTPEPVKDFEPAKPWVPRPAPGGRTLALEDVGALVSLPLDLARRAPGILAGAFRAGS